MEKLYTKGIYKNYSLLKNNEKHNTKKSKNKLIIVIDNILIDNGIMANYKIIELIWRLKNRNFYNEITIYKVNPIIEKYVVNEKSFFKDILKILLDESYLTQTHYTIPLYCTIVKESLYKNIENGFENTMILFNNSLFMADDDDEDIPDEFCATFQEMSEISNFTFYDINGTNHQFSKINHLNYLNFYSDIIEDSFVNYYDFEKKLYAMHHRPVFDSINFSSKKTNTNFSMNIYTDKFLYVGKKIISNTIKEKELREFKKKHFLDYMYHTLDNFNIISIPTEKADLCTLSKIILIYKKEIKQRLPKKTQEKKLLQELFMIKLRCTEEKIIKALHNINEKINNDYNELIREYISNAKFNFKDSKMLDKYTTKLTKHDVKLEHIFNKKELNTHFINKYKEIIEEEDDTYKPFLDSLEIYNSNLTMANWFDEYTEQGTMGIILGVETNDYVKLGINNKLINITFTNNPYMPFKDYLESIMLTYRNNSDKIYGDLNEISVMGGTNNGVYNSIIPIYINKEHWELARKHMIPALGLSLAHNPIGYLDKYKKFPFFVLSNMTNEIFNSNSKLKSERFFQSYMALWRTCSQLALESGYHKGIIKYVNDFCNKTDIFLHHNNTFELVTVFGQLLACNTPLTSDQLNKFIMRYILKIIYYRIESNSRKITSFKLDNTPIDAKNIYSCANVLKSIDDAILKINNLIVNEYLYLINFLKMSKFMKSWIKSKGGYKSFVNYLDENYSAISTADYNAFQQFQKANKDEFEDEDHVNPASMFIDNRNFAKRFVVSLDKNLLVDYYAIYLIALLYNKTDFKRKINLSAKYFGLISDTCHVGTYLDLIRYTQLL